MRIGNVSIRCLFHSLSLYILHIVYINYSSSWHIPSAPCIFHAMWCFYFRKKNSFCANYSCEWEYLSFNAEKKKQKRGATKWDKQCKHSSMQNRKFLWRRYEKNKLESGYQLVKKWKIYTRSEYEKKKKQQQQKKTFHGKSQRRLCIHSTHVLQHLYIFTILE